MLNESYLRHDARLPTHYPDIARLNTPDAGWHNLPAEDIIARISTEEGQLLALLKYGDGDIGQSKVPSLDSMLFVFDGLQVLAARGIKTEQIRKDPKTESKWPHYPTADWNAFRLIGDDDPLEATLRLSSSLTFNPIPAGQRESEVARVKATRANLAQAIWHHLSMRLSTCDIDQASPAYQRLQSLVDHADNLFYIFHFDGWYEKEFMHKYKGPWEDGRCHPLFLGSAGWQLTESRIMRRVMANDIIKNPVRRAHDKGADRSTAETILYRNIDTILRPYMTVVYVAQYADRLVQDVEGRINHAFGTIFRQR